jgi:hypothetical protein
MSRFTSKLPVRPTVYPLFSFPLLVTTMYVQTVPVQVHCIQVRTIHQTVALSWNYPCKKTERSVQKHPARQWQEQCALSISCKTKDKASKQERPRFALLHGRKHANFDHYWRVPFLPDWEHAWGNSCCFKKERSDWSSFSRFAVGPGWLWAMKTCWESYNV